VAQTSGAARVLQYPVADVDPVADWSPAPTTRQGANRYRMRRPERPPQAGSLPHNSPRASNKLMES